MEFDVNHIKVYYSEKAFQVNGLFIFLINYLLLL